MKELNLQNLQKEGDERERREKDGDKRAKLPLMKNKKKKKSAVCKFCKRRRGQLTSEEQQRWSITVESK